MDSRLDYIQHFYDDVDFVISGRKGSICEDGYLIKLYRPEYYEILQKHLSNPDQRVRVEVVRLLTNLRERQALDDVRRLRMKDNENVSSACLGYLTVLDEDDTVVPQLLDIMQHRDGTEFMTACRRMRAVGRAEDIPELRRIYGRVEGEMRNAVKDTMETIIDRNKDLIPRKRLLLSQPIFPDERKFLSFVDNSTVYLDIRYRDNVSEKDEISVRTYNNIADALRRIQNRLFNERDNLKYYGKEAKDGYDQVEDLFLWASDDLKRKKVRASASDPSPDCPECGNGMIRGRDGWSCPICGHR